LKALVKKFLDKEISRRGFMKGMVALGFSAKTIDSVLHSIAYAETMPPSEGMSFTGAATSFGIKGEVVSRPDQIKPAMKRAIQATKEGRPYLIDAIIAQMGPGAGTNWHPEISIATGRKSVM